MPRPRSDEKREAIFAAAIRVIVAQGLSAPTMGIAKEAGVANGSLFTYFETKADLFNQLYLELKTEMASVTLAGVIKGNNAREELFHAWRNWTNWAVAFPDKRRALTHLNVCDAITPETRATAHRMMAPIADLLERSRVGGAMRNEPQSFVLMLMNAMAEATIEFMTKDPRSAKKHCKAGFEALWRVVA